MSLAPSPLVQPRPASPKPGIVPARPREPRRTGRWLATLLTIALIGCAAFYWKSRSKESAYQPAFVSLRTASTASGLVKNTVRLTGVTAAANFVSLVTPQLSGSRADSLRNGSGGASSQSGSPATPSTGSTAGGNGTPATSSAAGASSAFKSATSRFGSTLRGSSGPAAASAAAPAASSTFGPSGLGTAADTLGGGTGGGGNGPGDFMMVLQDVVKPGSQVRKGQVVGEFDRQYMMLRLDDYRSSVVQSDASMRKRKADLEVTRKAHDQLVDSAKASLDKANLDLKTIPVLSAMDVERAKLSADQAEAKYKQLLAEVKFVRVSEEADIRNAELDLAQSKLEFKRAQANADRMIVKAPIDGLAIMQSIFRGGEFGQIQKGDQLWPGMFFMQVVNPSSMVINATMNQVDVDKLRIGSKATIHFDAYPGLNLPAHVDSIAAVTRPGGMRPTFVREVPVRIKLDQMDARVIPDLSVSADITVEAESSETTTVPAGAVFKEGTLEKTYVMVKQPSGWEKREVTLGFRNNVMAAVKSGLRPGEIVALDRPAQEARIETP